MTADAAPFTALARVYDAIMEDVEYAGWTEFLLGALRERGWPEPDGPGLSGARVLDLACGTGNSTRPLVERGFSVSGADASEPMLAVARAKLPGIAFYRTSFVDLDVPERYHLVVCMFDSLNNLTDPRDLLVAFQRVYSILMPGGWFVLDVNTREGVRELWDDDVFEGEVRTGSGQVRFRWTHRHDPATDLGHVRAECWGPEGHFVEEHTERGYDPDELERRLVAAGFGRISLREYPDGAAPDEHSPRVWAFARRPTEAWRRPTGAWRRPTGSLKERSTDLDELRDAS